MALNIINELNFYPKFKNCYFRILRTFKFDYRKDVKAAELLSELLKRKEESWNLLNVLTSFQNYIQSRKLLLIYGSGPSLEETVINLKHSLGENFFKQVINLAADGSSRCLRENNIPIDAIFTDLDGISASEFGQAKYMIVHAHGDNIDKILKFKEKILAFSNIIGTVQVDPLKLTLNPGGFTDGDRILFFIRSFLLSQHKIYLIGMDFKKRIGKYSKLNLKKSQKATKIKRKKLKFALKLVKWFQTLIKNDIIFINSHLKIKQFKNISVEDFQKFLY